MLLNVNSAFTDSFRDRDFNWDQITHLVSRSKSPIQIVLSKQKSVMDQTMMKIRDETWFQADIDLGPTGVIRKLSSSLDYMNRRLFPKLRGIWPCLPPTGLAIPAERTSFLMAPWMPEWLSLARPESMPTLESESEVPQLVMSEVNNSAMGPLPKGKQ